MEVGKIWLKRLLAKFEIGDHRTLGRTCHRSMKTLTIPQFRERMWKIIFIGLLNLLSMPIIFNKNKQTLFNTDFKIVIFNFLFKQYLGKCIWKEKRKLGAKIPQVLTRVYGVWGGAEWPFYVRWFQKPNSSFSYGEFGDMYEYWVVEFFF